MCELKRSWYSRKYGYRVPTNFLEKMLTIKDDSFFEIVELIWFGSNFIFFFRVTNIYEYIYICDYYLNIINLHVLQNNPNHACPLEMYTLYLDRVRVFFQLYLKSYQML